MIATVIEAPVEKPKTFKATASISVVNAEQLEIKTTGLILIYFKKDSLFTPSINMKLVFKKKLQEIQSPAGFNYNRYCLFNGITKQVFLKQNEYYLLTPVSSKQVINASRESIVGIIKKFIRNKEDAGLAEALLVGYKNDLDKSLVQSYSNTGVVHIIAISGLHLGVIYWILLLLLKPFDRYARLKWVKPLLVIAGLWSFSLLAGAQPSVLRAALMFSVILLGELAGRKSSIYNSLALSAFILLFINPFWLWDIGFQLSYAAVLSIVLFMRPVYNLFFIKNKWVDMLWKMNSVTIAAQILTTPLSIYHFHQFPNFFLLSNCIAVPLSTLVLFSEILLCLFSFLPVLPSFFGNLTSWMIRIMNQYVKWIELLPGSVSHGLQINTLQTILYYVLIAGISGWLLMKIKRGVFVSLFALLGILFIRAVT